MITLSKEIKMKYGEQVRLGLMLLTAFICMFTFALIMPFGDGPDEINRYKIVTYIINHGTLPFGDSPEVRIDGYGASYAFQPMLTYILDGFLLRFLRFFTLTSATQLLIARCVNICFGLVMALYVRRIAALVFSDSHIGWAFTLAVVFLPQNLFVHSYVNTDSMGLLSVSIIIYALLLGIQSDFNRSSILQLSIGIILCALSYYNCYGIILCAIFVFIVQFFGTKKTSSGNQIITYDYKKCFQKGGIICIIVLAGISWWFIRNAVLYHGDFLALNARKICAAATCSPEYNPLTRDTYASLGIPVFTMIFGTDYYTLVWKSFIAMFGPMTIPTHHYIYMSYKYCLIVALFGLILPIRAGILSNFNKKRQLTIHIMMLSAMILPAALAVYYSYTWEFQPQGRYFLPMLIPFMYFLAIGIQKLAGAITTLVGTYSKRAGKTIVSLLYHLLYTFIILSLLYSVFVSFLSYYRG